MGVFQALATSPFLLFGLFAGVWIDRKRRRPLLILSNVLTAILLALIPLAAWIGILNMNWLYVIVFLSATTSLLFELAYLSFLPSVVGREELAEGNSKLEISRSLAQVTGPSIAGWLIAAITAPFAILVDAVSYAISALFLSSVKVEEPEPKPAANQNVWQQIGEGLKVIVKHPILRSVAVGTAMFNFFWTATDTVFMLYIVNQLHLTPSQIGVVLGVGSVGALVGAMVASKWAARTGIGASIVGACVMIVVGGLIVPLADQPLMIALPMLVVARAFSGIGSTVYFVNQVSLRQAVTPNHLLGRINASSRFITRGAMPLGGIVSGAIGAWLGIHAAVTFAALGYVLGLAWFWFSPLRKIKTVEDATVYEMDV
jgi:MFS family permease